MSMHQCVPRWPLSEFVHLIWSYEGIVRPHPQERILPDGSVELVVSLPDEAGALIVGAHTRFFVIDTSKPLSVVGVHFKPGGARPFLALPVGELHNQVVPLDELWGAVARDLREHLLAASSPRDRFCVVEQCLLARAHGRLAVDPLVKYAVEQLRSARAVAAVASATGLSQHRFIDRFTAAVGLTPKRFARVMRFQNVVHAVATRDPQGWADLALACGYCDQAHFAHDFRAFSGLTPTEYLERRTPWLNHVPAGHE